MAAKVGEEVVKVYAGCPDISLRGTPDIKHAGRSSLVFVDLSGGHARLGGSALAQTFKQLGDVTPDCDTALLKRAFRATQRLLRERVLLAGHDRSDGGLLTTVLEMCFGGDCGCVMEATTENSVMEFLFNEELGLVVEVDDAKVAEVQPRMERLMYMGLLFRSTLGSTKNGCIAFLCFFTRSRVSSIISLQSTFRAVCECMERVQLSAALYGCDI